MKRMKELLLFMVTLFAPLVLSLVVSAFSADIFSDRLHFVGVANYIRLFLNDKTFAKALFNTVFAPALFSFLIVAVFAMIVFIVRKKIKVPRWVFYIGSVFAGAITALLYIVCVNMAFLRASEQSHAAQTIVSHIVDYSPSIFDVISISNVLLSLYIGIFIAFVFWVLELIIDIVKNLRRKGRCNEQVKKYRR